MRRERIEMSCNELEGKDYSLRRNAKKIAMNYERRGTEGTGDKKRILLDKEGKHVERGDGTSR